MVRFDYSKLWIRMAQRNMCDRDLARFAHISSATVSRMRAGKAIAASTIYKINHAMDCSSDWISAVPESEYDVALNEPIIE